MGLGACGGGGGSPGTRGGSSTDTGTVTSTTPTAASLQLSILNSANTVSSSISSTEQAQAVATVIGTDAQPMSGVTVSFQATGTPQLTFTPASGLAQTGNNGQATITFMATTPGQTGTVSVTAQVLSSSTVSATQQVTITP